MEKIEKIEFMRKRIEFFYPEDRIAAEKYCRRYTFLNDFTQFCKDHFSIVDYCFYLGEYCKINRKWLSDYKKWKVYIYNYDIDRKMSCLLEALIIETLFQYGKNSKLEEILSILKERYGASVTSEEKSNYINDKRSLIYAFMAGLMDVTDDEIDKFWVYQNYLIDKEAEEAHKVFSELRSYSYQESEQTDYTPENAVMDALERGDGDATGF